MTRILPRFPASVQGINALSATTTNGVLTIGIDPTNLANSADPTAMGNKTFILNTTTDEFELAEVASTVVDIATQAEAEAGTDNTAINTPLRTKQQTDARLATQVEAEAGANTTKLMTPLLTKQAAQFGNFTPAGSGAVVRTIQSKLRDAVHVKDFGAVGDGVTNDSAAFSAALATGRDVLCSENATYVLKDVIVTSGLTLDGNGAVFVPASGALFCFKMSGFRPRLLNARFSDTNSNLIRSSTLAAGVSAGSSTFTLAAGHGMQAGQAFWLLMDNGRPFMSHVASVVGNTLTTTSPLISAVSSARICRASFGSIYCNDTTFFDIFDVQLVGASAGIWIDGNAGDTGKGTIKNLRGFTYKHFGIALARGVHEVTVDDYFLRGGFVDVTNATGNGVQTAFTIPNEVRMKREISVTVNGAPQTYTTNFTVTANGPTGATVTFTSAPANGAAIVFTNYAFSEFGVWSDSTGWNTIRGGSRFHKGVTIHHRVGRFIQGRELEEHANNQDDTASYIGTWVKDCGRDMWFDNHYAGYAFEPILVEHSISVNFSGRLATWITPSIEWTATVTPQAFAVQGIGGTTRVIIDPWGWTVSSDKTIFGAGSTVYTQIPTDKVTGGTASLPFSNSWVNVAAPNGPLIAAKGADNIVTLDGAIQSGSVGYNTVIATLPLGYRPARTLVFPVSANGAVAFVGVKSDGTIIQEWGPNLDATITSLGGISFEVA